VRYEPYLFSRSAIPATGKRGSNAHHHMILFLAGCPYMMIPTATPPPVERFPLGRIVATPGALAAIPDDEIQTALRRHHHGDWGDLGKDDHAANETALLNGERLLSVYRTKAGVKFYIITEHDRSATTVLLPEDY
jgi:hypothetical protein